MTRTPASSPGEDPFVIGSCAWPSIRLQREPFLANVERLGLAPAVACARAEDLFLATACAGGDAPAIKALERVHLSRVPQYLGRFDLANHQVNEVRQRLTIRLLCAPHITIGHYNGTGPLSAWIRTSAVRIALDLLRERQLAEEVDCDFLEATSTALLSTTSPELEVIKEQKRELLRSALHEAFQGLSPTEKTITRLHWIDGLSLEAIARLYRVHRATVARWLLAARSSVLRKVEERLCLKIQLSRSEVRSIVANSQRDISSQVLKTLADG
jgi:RNA polymerase sigma-70 factor (ECF subfamily)